jgi:hypothetical protein
VELVGQGVLELLAAQLRVDREEDPGIGRRLEDEGDVLRLDDGEDAGADARALRQVGERELRGARDAAEPAIAASTMAVAARRVRTPVRGAR